MSITAPDIKVDATIGEIIVVPTPAPSSEPTPSYTFPGKKYKQSALSIYGYGPINSVVSLKGFGVSETTISDKTGLFRFTGIYSYTKTYPELCVQAVDDKNRATQPSCIPALPNTSLIPLEVGPILLSPTLSLSDNKIVEGGEGYMSGKTTPNTDVYISIAKGQSKTILLSLVSTVEAYNLPQVKTTSNEKGEFDINMPSSDIAEYRIFASTKFADNLSAKSTTLTFAVISSTKSFLLGLWDYFLQNKIIAFILAEVLMFIMLFVSALKSTTRKHKRHTERDYLNSIWPKA